MANGEVVVEESVSAPRAGATSDQVADEERPRMGGGEPICRLVIDRKLLLQRQAVEVCPSLAKPHLQIEFIAVQYKAKTFVRRILLATSFQRQRRGQRCAEPN